MAFYYEQAEDGEIIGIVPFDIEPLEDNRLTGLPPALDYNLLVKDDSPVTLAQGLSIFVLVTVLMLGGALLSAFLIPISIIGVLYYMIRKYI